MPTRFDSGKLIHTCQYCKTEQADDPAKSMPFLFLNLRCIGCGRSFEKDLDFDLIERVQASLRQAQTTASAAPGNTSPESD